MEWKKLLLVFLITNALFWGLFPHETHCKLVSYVSTMKCPSHNIHLLMGLLSYMLAVYLTQKDTFN